MDHFNTMLALLVGGFLLLGFGFNYREREWGVRLIGVGVLVTLAPIAVHIFRALQLPG